MRRAERPPVGQRAAFDLAGDRGDHRDFEEFGRRQRRQDRRQPRRQHRFAGAGRADHEQIVAAGGRDFERALGAFLALDVGEIECRACHSRIFGCGRDSTCVPLKWLASWMSEDAAMISISGLAQAASGPQAAGHIKPSPRALAPIAAGSTPATAAIEPSRPSSPSTVNPAKRVVRNGADRRHQPERDRQIVVAAFLGQIGRREIDGDAPRRQRQPGRDHRRAHPLARFRNRLVGQTDDGEGRHPRRHLHLDVDGPDLDALERNRGDALDHVRPCRMCRVPQSEVASRTFHEHAILRGLGRVKAACRDFT